MSSSQRAEFKKNWVLFESSGGPPLEKPMFFLSEVVDNFKDHLEKHGSFGHGKYVVVVFLK